ncbi:hypothetical protein QQS21_003985 [Conoideocrella luteorostrata]|uniref:Uncharacterized protein n=1 Tax=Conoideocrella luteorostrata TaxID=1105319 RepID=A0AAJ0CSA5_9HYPO|nr:hypothetical protein QQS21_003985 [Conoideocrella luteorostrata]
MASQSSDVEILVHVAAPGRVSDDATYRQLANAYLAFQPEPESRADVAQVTVPQARTARVQTLGRDRHQHQHEVYNLVGSEGQNFATAATEQHFGPESQDLSFQGAIDNRSSPRFRPTVQFATAQTVNVVSPPKPQPCPPSRSPWRSPPSQIPDSYPLPDAGIINVTPTRVLERYLQHARPPGSSSSPPSSPSSCKDRSKPPSPTANFGSIDVPSSIPTPDSKSPPSRRQQRRNPTKTIPVTPAPPPGNLHKRHVIDQDDPQPELDFDLTHISSSFVSLSSSTSASRAGSEPPSTKALKRAHQGGEIDSVQLTRTSSDTGPVRSSGVSSTIEQIATTLDITPPSPPVSVTNIDPTSLVSSKLDKLARDLSSRYKPIASRHVSPFERGYWLVDCTSWTEPVRLDTWVFLTNYLRSGLAGWGVWCRRDKLHDWIRFYCWGHVTKHTYLLLYLASGRQIKTTGAKWFDAAGDPVLEVAGVEKRL